MGISSAMAVAGWCLCITNMLYPCAVHHACLCTIVNMYKNIFLFCFFFANLDFDYELNVAGLRTVFLIKYVKCKSIQRSLKKINKLELLLNVFEFFSWRSWNIFIWNLRIVFPLEMVITGASLCLGIKTGNSDYHLQLMLFLHLNWLT